MSLSVVCVIRLLQFFGKWVSPSFHTESFILSRGSQLPGQLGTGELAICLPNKKEYVANADDHAYC